MLSVAVWRDKTADRGACASFFHVNDPTEHHKRGERKRPLQKACCFPIRNAPRHAFDSVARQDAGETGLSPQSGRACAYIWAGSWCGQLGSCTCKWCRRTNGVQTLHACICIQDVVDSTTTRCLARSVALPASGVGMENGFHIVHFTFWLRESACINRRSLIWLGREKA
jgi:hypothetical protein